MPAGRDTTSSVAPLSKSTNAIDFPSEATKPPFSRGIVKEIKSAVSNKYTTQNSQSTVSSNILINKIYKSTNNIIINK